MAPAPMPVRPVLSLRGKSAPFITLIERPCRQPCQSPCATGSGGHFNECPPPSPRQAASAPKGGTLRLVRALSDSPVPPHGWWPPPSARAVLPTRRSAL